MEGRVLSKQGDMLGEGGGNTSRCDVYELTILRFLRLTPLNVGAFLKPVLALYRHDRGVVLSGR